MKAKTQVTLRSEQYIASSNTEVFTTERGEGSFI